MASIKENNLELNYGWPYGESGWNSGMDENIVKLGFESRKRINGILSSPPSSPSNGDAYIVGTAPTGLFSGKFANIAIYDRGSWVFITPKSQEVVFNTSDGCNYIYNNGWSLKLEAEVSPYIKIKDFTFSTGYTITDQKQCLLNITDNHYYQWNGTLPKVVSAGSTPTTAGGVGVGAWVDRTDVTLRSEIRETVFQNMKRLYAEAGFNLVDGSFQMGGSLSGWTDVLWDWATGRAYVRVDAFSGNITIQPNSVPTAEWVVVDPKYKASVTPEMFGADGADDTTIIKRARNFIIAMGGGTLTLTRPYVVGKQIANHSPNSTAQYWQSVDDDMLTFTGINGVNIYFEQGAELKFSDGLRYGSFHPLTGEVYNAASGGFTNAAYGANPSNMINFVNCLNCTVRAPKINGNMDNIIKGGYWGDVGIQLTCIGIRSVGSVNTTIFNPDIKDMLLDGLYATGSEDQWINFKVHGGTVDRCGRQGFSWTGGDGVFFYGTILKNSGTGPISSSPGANIDIEDNGSGCKFGRFYDLKVYGSIGAGVLTLNTTDNIKFYNCEIASLGPSGYRALWPASEGIELHNCKIYGSVVNATTADFFNCYFTNKFYESDEIDAALFLDIDEPVTFHGGVIESFHPSGYGFNLRGGCKVLGTKFLFSATDPVKRKSMGRFSGNATVKDAELIQNYSFVNTLPTDIEASGECTFIENIGTNTIITGRTTIKGGGLAWGSRTGNINSVVSAIKQVTYTEEFTYTTSGTGPTFIIPLNRTGTYMVTLYKTSGDTTLRNVRAIWLVCSQTTSTVANHSFFKTANIYNTLGGGGSVEMGVSNGLDTIVLTQGSIALNGEVWTVRINTLLGTMAPL